MDYWPVCGGKPSPNVLLAVGVHWYNLDDFLGGNAVSLKPCWSPFSLEHGVSQAQFAKTIVWLLRVQAVLAVLASAAWWLTAGAGHGLAALVGGSSGVALTALVALRMALSQGAAPEDIVRGFYRAMWLKLALAAFLFIVVARWFAPWFGPVLTGYCATLLAYWWALWRIQGQMVKQQQDL